MLAGAVRIGLDHGTLASGSWKVTRIRVSSGTTVSVVMDCAGPEGRVLTRKKRAGFSHDRDGRAT